MSGSSSSPRRTAARRVLVVDDHPVFRQGLKQLINLEPDMTVCGEAESRVQALGAIDALKPDVVLADVSLKESDGIELVKDIKMRYPDMPVLVLSMHDESLYAERALRAGACGYIMKQEATDKIMIALRHVLNGNLYLSENASSRLLHRVIDQAGTSTPLETLSDREMQVLRLMGRGLNTRQIAQELHLGVPTVETHRASIKRKLNLSNATELVKYAVRWGESNA